MKLSKTHHAIALFISILILLAVTSQTAAAAITVLNLDDPGEGFNDPTAATPVAGNSGTTIGQQRFKAFEAAADFWSAYLNNSVPIVIGVNMDPLSCGSRSAVLGSAGPNTVFRDFANAPQAATWYPVALANELAGVDLSGANAEISATFNSSIDNNDNCLRGSDWWYGITSASPNNDTSFYETVLHEIAHGLGFLTLTGQNGDLFAGRNDHFMLNLMDNNTNKIWPAMNDTERAISSINNQLVWTGRHVRAASSFLSSGRTAQGFVRMYSPNPYDGGSSVSHWDTRLAPDELMEPFSTLTTNSTLTKKMFCDIGWPASGCNTTTPEVPVTPPAEDEPEQPFISRWLNILLPAAQQASQNE